MLLEFILELEDSDGPYQLYQRCQNHHGRWWVYQNTQRREHASVQNPPANYILCEGLEDAPLTKVSWEGRATALLRGSVVTVL